MHYPPNQIHAVFHTEGIAEFSIATFVLDCCISYGGGYGNRTHLNSCLQGKCPPHADPSPIELSFGYHPSTATISPSSIFECGLLALRLLGFDDFILLQASKYAKRYSSFSWAVQLPFVWYSEETPRVWRLSCHRLPPTESPIPRSCHANFNRLWIHAP